MLVVEARGRVGGRVFTVDAGPERVELGAEFVHGRPAELLALLKEAGLDTFELDGEQVCFEHGQLKACGDESGRDFEWLETLSDWTGEDCSFAEYLVQAKVPEESRPRLINYVEGFNAADHREISAASLGKQQKAEDEIEADRLFRVRGGYDQVPKYLARKFTEAGGQLSLSTQVESVEWSEGRVALKCAVQGRASTFDASKVVVTVPLSLLQRRSLAFDPEPEAIWKAAGEMRMGNVSRDVLLFTERVWASSHPTDGDLSERKLPGGNVSRADLSGGNADLANALRRMGFLFSFESLPPVWWTEFPEESRILTGWTGGPRSETWKSAGERVTAIHHALSKIFGMAGRDLEAVLEGHFSHDWRSDPFSYGAYSYVAAGGMDASERMGVPVKDTLYFAGEHTDTSGHWGTVHGAMRSGLRVAEQILRA